MLLSTLCSPFPTTTLPRLLRAGALVAALPLAARAQVGFRPGYVVPVTGDTLRGEIDCRDLYFNSRQCRFRAAPAAEARTYRPGELLAYGLPAENKHYRTLTLPTGGPAAYFAEVLVSGPATLYTLRDRDRADHYYLEAPQFALAELVNRRVLAPGQTFARDEPVYRITLQQALPGCPQAEVLLPQLAFTATALEHVVTVFNACRGVVAPPTQRPGSGARPHLGVLVGGQLVSTSLTFPGSNPGQSITLDLPTTGGVALGLRLGVPLTGLSRRLGLEANLLYTHQHYEATSGSNATFGGLLQRYAFTLNYLRLPLLLRYTPGAGPVQPVFELGPTFSYAVRLDATTTTVDATGRTTSGMFFSDNQRRFQEALLGGVGVAFPYWQQRRAALLARAEFDTGWTEGLGLKSGANRYYLLLALDLTN